MTERCTNVTDFLIAGKEPARIALQLTDGNHTYGELQRAAAQFAESLWQLGGQKGQRVILVSPNSFFWVAAYLGTLRAGMVCVPLPLTVSAQDLDYVLQTTDARIALVQGQFLLRNSAHFKGIHVVSDGDVPPVAGVASHSTFGDISSRAPGETPRPSIVPEDLAALMFTSGSTGRPRGVMISHANIMANTESIREYLNLTENDRIMTVLPFHYCFGTSLLHTHLRVGASLVIDMSFMYPEAILQRMIDTECTGLAGVPSHFQILLRNSSMRKKTFPKLRYIQQAGGPLAECFLRELRETLPATRIFVMYGQTEATARLSYLPPEFLDRKLGSIGKGIPGVQLRVLNEAGEEVSPGEVGEIVAKGENVARGYWCAPEESAMTFRGGQLHTGDLARVDEDGFIYIVDRIKDFVKCGGTRIGCRQLEEKLLEFEELLEAAVVGIPDDVLGESVKAFVVPRAREFAGLQERLTLFCKARMPHQLVPKEIVVLSSLPKNSAGKVLKSSLKTL